LVFLHRPRSSLVSPQLDQLVRDWQALKISPIRCFDYELVVVGQPEPGSCSFYRAAI